MSEVDVSNTGYSKIIDSIHNKSEVANALKDKFPPSYRVVKGTVDYSQSVNQGSTAVAKILNEDGSSVKLNAGETILSLSYKGTGLTTTSVPTIAVGLAATDGGASAAPVLTALSTALINTGATLAGTTLPLAVSANLWPVATTATATIVAGKLMVVIIVV